MKLTNITANVHLNLAIDLDKFKQNLPEGTQLVFKKPKRVKKGEDGSDHCVLEFFGKPKRRAFQAVPWRIVQFGITALVYGNGKIVLVGCKSVAKIVQTVDFIKKTFNVTANVEINYSNFVATHDIGFKIDLPSIWAASMVHGSGFCRSYDPERFHGLVWTSGIAKGIAIFFHTGKFNITGCKSTDELLGVGNAVLNLLRTHFKGDQAKLDLVNLSAVTMILPE